MLLAATHPPTVTRCAKWRERLRRSTARLAAGGLPCPAASRQPPECGAAFLSGENAELKRGQQRHNEEMHALDAQRREELQTLEVRPLCSRPHPYAALSQPDRQPTRSDWGLASSAHKRRSLASSSATAWSLAHRLARARRRCGPPLGSRGNVTTSIMERLRINVLACRQRLSLRHPSLWRLSRWRHAARCHPALLPTQRLDGRLLLSPQAVRSSPRARRAWVWRAERRRTARGRPAPAQASLGSGPQPRTATGGNTWSGRRRRSRGADAVCFCDDPSIRRQL